MKKKRNKKSGYGLFVFGEGLVAWFADPKQGQEFGSANYTGQWVLIPHKVPSSTQFTKKEIQEAEREAKKIWEHIEARRLKSMPE